MLFRGNFSVKYISCFVIVIHRQLIAGNSGVCHRILRLIASFHIIIIIIIFSMICFSIAGKYIIMFTPGLLVSCQPICRNYFFEVKNK